MTKKRKNPQNVPKPKTLRLKDNHTWKAPKGHKIVVIDRGAVSFNVPEDWHIVAFEPFEMRDKPEPDDNARLMVTVFRAPPGIDWSALPLDKLLEDSSKPRPDDKPEVETLERTPVERMERDDLEVVWSQHLFIDPEEKREAHSRIAMARGWNLHVLITLDYWVSDKAKLLPVWQEVLRSLQLGRNIEDPTRGEMLH